MVDASTGVPDFARDLVTRGLDALAQKVSEAGERSPAAVAKLANLWTSLTEEERLQVGAGIVAAATAAAMAIPATIAAVKKKKRKKAAAAPAKALSKKEKKRMKKEKKKEKKKR